MILQAQTPRSLSWAGCLVVLGLGLFLLPLVPVQAQEKAKDPFAQAPPAEKESVDQQIETLKKAIMILEQQKQTQKTAKPEEKKVDPAELDKAKHEVDQLAKLLELKRQELNTLQAKHQQALARLAALQGWKVKFDNEALHLDKLQFDLQRYKNAQNFKPIEVQMDVLKSQVVDPTMLRNFIYKKADPNVRPREDKKPAESLEQKLHRLMKEIEELRKEIRKDKPSVYYQPAK